MDKKIFDIAVDTEDFSQQGIFTISIVDKPAIQSNFIYLSEQEEKKNHGVFMFNEYRKEVVGAFLIPDKLIRRYNDEFGEYYIRFSKETIEELVYKFSKDGIFNMFNIEHSEGVDDIYLTELWIKESDQDKSAYIGFSDLPVGTAFLKAKIDNDMVWEDIKGGKLNGFSIELSSYIVPSNLTEMKEENQEATPEVVYETPTTEKMSEETMDAIVAKLKEALLPAIEEMLSAKAENNEELTEQAEEPVAEPEAEAEVAVAQEEDTAEGTAELSETAEVESDNELSEQAEQETEESLSEESENQPAQAEVELSEVEAEEVLLSEQAEQAEEELSSPKTITRDDEAFWDKVKSIKRNF